MNESMFGIPRHLQLVQVFRSIKHSTNVKIEHKHNNPLTSIILYDTQQEKQMNRGE